MKIIAKNLLPADYDNREIHYQVQGDRLLLYRGENDEDIKELIILKSIGFKHSVHWLLMICEAPLDSIREYLRCIFEPIAKVSLVKSWHGYIGFYEVATSKEHEDEVRNIFAGRWT